MKKVLLCIPPLDLKTIVGEFGGIWAIGSSMPPQGLCHIGAFMRERGHRTAILDCQITRLSMDEAVERVLQFGPDFVGISSTTVSIKSAGRFAENIKLRNPSIVTVIGGVHVSALPVETLDEFRGFDVGVVGEGEATFAELVDAPVSAQAWKEIPGLVIRESGNIRQTCPRPFIKDLDAMPLPAWDMCPNLAKNYRTSSQRCLDFPVASLITSRGCPFNCTFCDRSVFGQALRANSAGYVIEMIKELKYRHGIRAIVFNDDMFMGLKERLVDICRSIIREKIKISWSCSGRVDMLELEVLKLMKSAGCWQMAVGIESGDEEVLAQMKKRTDTALIRKALSTIKEAGISVKGLFIIGMPGDTAQTIERTIEFSKAIDIDDAQFSIFTPYPGSEMYRYVIDKEGFVPDWEKMNTVSPSYVPKGLTADDLLIYQKKASKEFYLRPRPVIHQLKKLRNPRYAGNVLREAFCFLKYITKA